MDNRDTQTCIRISIISSSACCIFLVLIMMGYGIWILMHVPYDDVNLHKTMSIAGIMNVTVALITFIISIVGSFSSIVNKKLLYIIFAILTLVNSLMMLGLGIYLFIISARSYSEHFRSDLERMLLPKFLRYFVSREDKRYIDEFQKFYGCCGLFGMDDWYIITAKVPDSCWSRYYGWHEIGCTEAITGYSTIFTVLAVLSIISAISGISTGILVIYFANIIQPEVPFFNPIIYNTAPPPDAFYPRG